MLHAALLMTALSTAEPQVPDSTRQGPTLDEARVTALRNTAFAGGAPSLRVSAADIEARGAVALSEVLRTLPGVSVRDYGGVGGLQTVSIRGFSAQHTAVVADGIVLVDTQSGQVDISRYRLDDVASVRVDIAGSDDIFRPARLAGYVGTVTLTAQPLADSSRVDALLRYGSFGTWNPRVSLQQPLSARWRLGASAHYLRSAGDYPFILRNGQFVTTEHRLNSAVSQGTAALRLDGDLRRCGTLRFKADAYSSSRGLPGSVVLYTQHPSEHLWRRQLNASALHESPALEGRYGAWRTQSILAYNLDWTRYTDHAATLPTPTDDHYTQQHAALSSTVLWTSLCGLQASVGEDLDMAHLSSTLPAALQPTRLTSHTAVAAKYTAPRITTSATLLAIVSAEHLSDGPSAPSRQRLCPSLTLSAQPTAFSGWRLRAACRETYRLPTFNDLYYLRVGNRNLRPELARQVNVGTMLRLGSRPAKPAAERFASHLPAEGSHTSTWALTLTADAFYNNVRDKIVAIPTLFVWHMRNVGRVDMLGADLSASATLLFPHALRVGLSGSYSLQHAVDVTDPAAKNYRHQIPYTPRHSGSALATFATPWFTLSYTLSAAGERYALAQNTPAYRLAPYADHSLSLSHTFGPWGTLARRGAALNSSGRWRLHLSAEALNIGGRNYEVIKYFPMPGRQFRLTAKIMI